jgi:hypothetical protein
LFGAALALSLLTVALIVGAGAVVTRRLWSRTPWLAPAYGLLSLGLAAHVAWLLCWWSRAACVSFAVAVMVLSAAALVRARFWSLWRTWLPLAALSSSVLALAVGHTFLWGGLRDPFLTVATRYGALPGDNVLQYKFAYHLWNHLSTVLFYSDWNGSDRPPLQSGVLLLTRPFESLMGVSNGVSYTDVHGMQWGLAASIVAQLMWVPGLYALLRALRFGPGVAALTIAFVSVLPLAVWNTTFTWPKMMSAGLALAALAILVTVLLDRPTRVAMSVCSAAALFVLAFLSHGAAAFVAPAFVVLGLMAIRGRGFKTSAAVSALIVVTAALLYLPWVLYGKYADPNHARLLKWHFAGVIPPDNRPFLPTLIDAYRNASMSEIMGARRANLSRVFDHGIDGRLHPGTGWQDSWRSQDFFSPTFAIGLGTLVLVFWLGFWLTGLLRRRRRSAELTLSVVVVLACFACMIAWALVLFLPDGATVHVGTYVWLLVFAAIPFAWMARWSVRIAVPVLVAQAAYAAVVYNDPNAQFSQFRQPKFSDTFALLAAAGVVGLTLAVVVLMRAEMPVPAHRAARRPLHNGSGLGADDLVDEVASSGPLQSPVEPEATGVERP